MAQRYALDFFPQNALGDGPAFWIFFQDSRIRVRVSINVFIPYFGFRVGGKNIEIDRFDVGITIMYICKTRLPNDLIISLNVSNFDGSMFMSLGTPVACCVSRIVC